MLAVRRACHLHPLQWVPERGAVAFSRRTILSKSVEPPPASEVSERPCEVVLAQDPLYDTCWQEPFAKILPHECGLHFCSVSLDCKNLQDGLDMLEQDLATLPNVVMIARGPLVSLIAQYYLESLPLAGLVLVDPVLINHKDVLQKLETRLGQASIQHEFVESLLSDGNATRPLKLEPGVVPMLVFQSLQDECFRKASNDVALRHGDPEGIFGPIPLHDVSSSDRETEALAAIDVITEWIDDSVL